MGKEATAGHALAPDVRVRDVRVLVGHSLWRAAPAAACRVAADAPPSPALAARLEALRAALPAPPPEGDGATGGTAVWAHAVGALAVGLQRAAGIDVVWWRVAAAGTEHVVAVEYEEEGTGWASLDVAADLVEDVVAGVDPDVARAVDTLRARRRREHLAPDAAMIVAEARRRGIPVRRVPRDPVVQLGLGSRQRRVDATLSDRTSVLAADLAADGERARRLLRRLGVPVPRGSEARSAEEAVEIADGVGYPVLVTTTDHDDAHARAAPLDTPERVREAFARADRSRVVVERYVEGRAHRVLVVQGRVIAVEERAADGATVDRTDAIHPDNAALCAFAADAVGLDVAGVDVVTPDVSVPFRANGAVVTAVRARPTPGAPRDVAAIVDALFPPGAECRVPILAVTGTNGKTTTTRLLAHVFRGTGARVGFATTDGVYHEEHTLLEGDLTGPMGADMVLSNPRVDVAVLETARGGILRAGLGYDGCDAAVVLNVTADHLGIDGIDTVEQLAAVKAVVVRAVRPGGHAVLNADDPLALAMRADTDAEIVLFTAGAAEQSAPVRAHLAAGGRAASVEPGGAGGGTITLHRGGERTPLVAVADAPMTAGGAAWFQVANAAAASAAAWARGVSPEAIRAALASFTPSARTTPGRMNVVRVGEATVVVDYAHNEAAISALLDYARRTGAARRLGVLGMPGDRNEAALRATGALVVGLDLVIFKEHARYRRGRAAGETARGMLAGYLDAGGDPSRALVTTDEGEAVDALLARLRPGDLALFLADDAASVLAALERAPGA